MPVVTRSTNRLDLFARAHLGSNDTEAMRAIINANLDYFERQPTFWLEEGVDLNLAP